MTSQKMIGAEIVLKVLREQGVDTIFGYPGGAVLPLYDALFQQNDIRHVLVRHEQAALHAAEGYARSTGKVGVALVTSGPGATNAVTGLADAWMDSIPLICLTGQVPTHLIGNDAFQEADITGITRPCTKHNYLVKDVGRLAQSLHEAFYVARSGRPGPVLVDLPKDILQKEGHYISPSTAPHKSYRPKTIPEAKEIAAVIQLLKQAKKPIIYGGGGLINSGVKAAEFLRTFAEMTNMPVTLTLMGLGAFPATHPQFLGMLGMHGTYEANMAMHDCDVMLCIGARFDDRVTGKVSAFSPHSKKIHIDIDPSSINKSVLVDRPVIADAAEALKTLIAAWDGKALEKDSAWWQQIQKWRAVECLKFTPSLKTIKPQQAIAKLYELTKDKHPYITTEIGQHQMWTAQLFGFEAPNHFMTSGGLGTMGYGLPAAIGVQIAHPESLVIDVAGDASIMMNIQELATAKQHQLPVKIFIVNNQYMGMVRQWQELHHGERYSQSYTDSLPDFVKLAEAFGAKGKRVTDPKELDQAILEMINTPTTYILEVCVEHVENCFPMIPAGAAHNEILLKAPEKHNKPKTKKTEEGMVLV